MSKSFRLVIFSFIAALFIWLMLKKNVSFFDAFLALALTLCAAVFVVINAYKDVKEFKAKRTLKSFLPTLCCVTLVAIFGVIVTAANQTNNSPCLLQATYDSGSSSSFIFRRDSTFQWTNGSGLGVSTEEGRYSMKGDMITLDREDFDKIIKTKYLKITSELPWTQLSKGKYVVQVNNKGEVIDKMFFFTIYVDKRNETPN